jgi:hypothetical protein
MQNMKLLDLQTGKYLELGKDFLYGGGYITICDGAMDIACGQIKNQPNKLNFIQEYFHVYKQSEPQEPLKTLCEKTGAVIYGGRYVLMDKMDGTVMQETQYFYKKPNITSKSKSTVKYYLNNNSCFKVFCSTWQELRWICNDEEAKFIKDGYIFCKTSDNVIVEYGNIFEEYSKQLRNEPNKFEELMALIK